MTEQPTEGRRPRRLGVSLVFTIVVLIGLAGLVVGTRWHRQKSLVDQVETLGGQVEARPIGPAWFRDFAGPEFMQGWDPITGINLADRDVDDAWLTRHIGRQLRELEWIDLTNTRVTSSGLNELTLLPQLKEVYIKETTITDADLVKFDAAHPDFTVVRGRKSPVATSLAMRTVHWHALTCAAFSPSGNLLAVGDGEGTLHVWNVARRELVRSIPAHAEWVFGVAFAPDGRTLATAGGDNLVRRWDVMSGELVDEYAGHHGDVHAVAFTPDGNRLLSAGDDMMIHFIDTESLRPECVLAGHTAPIPALDVSPDGTRIASGSRDDSVRLWDVATGESLAVLEDHTGDVHAVAFSPDGKWLATASYDGTIKLRDPDDGRTVRTFIGHDDWVFTVAFSGDGKTLASGSGDGTIRLWDVATGAERRQLAKQHTVSRVAFSSGDDLLASSAAEGNVGLWSPEDGELLGLLRAPGRRIVE